ncbi:MAG: NUDIX hydrolase [Gammaproteobacteria bacterium]|nr:NUDIX hydrolase [Gammaproteobacteria bacterium]MBU1655436.1 NUDIX hydrolase [Gammaproteobacteria bacterium]MBU1962403.1 NUDIX hydrolase [Gammaproteobacteria bacterium]
MPWTPCTTVAVIAEREGHFLFVLEWARGRQVINQPAGHLEENEHFIQAAIRETREETAWGFRPDGLVGIYRWRIPPQGPTYVRYCFHGQVDDHRPDQALDEGIIEALWLTPAEVRSGHYQLRSPMVLRCLDDHLNGRHFPLELINEMD